MTLRLMALLQAVDPPVAPEEWRPSLDQALALAKEAGPLQASVTLLVAKLRLIAASEGAQSAPAVLELFRQARALFSDAAPPFTAAVATRTVLPTRSRAYVQFALPAIAALLAVGDVREAQGVLEVLTGLLKDDGAATLAAAPDDYILVDDAHLNAVVYLLAGLCRQRNAADQAHQFFTLGLGTVARALCARTRARARARPSLTPRVRVPACRIRAACPPMGKTMQSCSRSRSRGCSQRRLRPPSSCCSSATSSSAISAWRRWPSGTRARPWRP